MSIVKGIDISKWQGRVTVDDFQKAKAFGVEFVYIKSSEGYGTDPKFADNARAARDAGLIYGAYHFARPDTHAKDHIADAEKEARNMCGRLPVLGTAMLPPALDYEKYFSGLSQKQKREWVQAFVGVVQHLRNVSPIIYTGPNVWHYQLGDWKPEGCPLWVVRYSNVGTIPQSQMAQDVPHSTKFPMPWDEWTMWQWSGGGKYNHHGPVPGFKNPVDVNWFNGDMGDLRTFAGMPPTPSVEPEPPGLTFARNMLGFHTEQCDLFSESIEAYESEQNDG